MTKEGEMVMNRMRKKYKSLDKAKDVFYASINAKKPGTEKWHKKGKTILTGNR
jgi:hypothetical protein